jgi:CubicO group peptidase (beta-lactamase class C family)
MVTMRFASALLIAIWSAGLFLAPAWGETAVSCGRPLEAGDEWPTGSPEAAGLDPAILCSLNETLDKSPDMNVHAVLVVRGGKLVYETYRSGLDFRWTLASGMVTHTPQMQHDVRSMSKSVVSLLVGIALDRKLIASIDDPVFTYFPQYASLRTPAKDRILLRHLLTMRSGLQWDELHTSFSDPTNSGRMMYRSSDPYRFVLEQPVQHEPDEKFNYSGGNTQLLAGVLQKATGEPLAEFAKAALFEPLGITQFTWPNGPASGEVIADWGLRLRPRDMAKIGELVLRKGMWNGRRVVSEAWIEESTQARPTNESFGMAWNPLYGYQWWMGNSAIGDHAISWIAGIGWGGQRIYIAPAYDLIVVITSGLYFVPIEDQDRVVKNIFDHYVLAAIRR